MIARHVAVVSAVLLGLSSSLQAQWMRGADSLSAQAVADSQNVLRDLNAAIRRTPNDAALRYHAGMVAWVLSIRSEFPPAIRGLNGPALKGLADSSLRLAIQAEPRNPRYQLDFSRFLRASSNPVLRLAAPRHVDAALDAARADSTSTIFFESLSERARLAWLMYDTEVNQIVGCDKVFPPSLDSASNIDATGGHVITEVALKVIHNELVSCPRAEMVVDNGDYIKAENFFRELYNLSPVSPRTFRNLAMLFIDKARWAELNSLARDRTRLVPADAWGWLALGLALHRSNQSGVAVAAFDSGMARLDARERARLFEFTKLMSPADSTGLAKLNDKDRAERENTFWAYADPLWSRKGNDPRTEFLARVTYAELRWTVDEFQVRGADSDRGQVHIRYGPPTFIIGVYGCYFRKAWPQVCADGVSNAVTDLGTASRPAPSDVVTFWDYDIGLTVVFWGAPTYGTAHFPPVDLAHIERVLELRPAAFDNIAREKIVPIPVSVTRFRATADSVDILAFTQVPMAPIRDASANAPVRLDAWLFGKNDEGEARDSSIMSGSGTGRVTYRVAPGTYMYRVEATAAGTLVAGRATQWVVADRDTVSGFSVRGFGLSDILFATAARPNKTSPTKWRDFDVAPLIGVLPRAGNLELLWENYGLGARDGKSDYTVTITLARQRSTGGKIAATIMGFARSAVGVERQDDRVTFKFDRVGGAAPEVFADRVTLSMNGTPAGEYRLMLEITDRVTGRKAQNVRTVIIGD